jgi:hypothetical protein
MLLQPSHLVKSPSVLTLLSSLPVEGSGFFSLLNQAIRLIIEQKLPEEQDTTASNRQVSPDLETLFPQSSAVDPQA